MMPHDVTQADREAAASLSDAVFCHPDIVAEAFAAHRLAAIAEERARVVAWLRKREAFKNNGPLGIPHWAYREIANQIERGDHIQEK